MMYTYMSLLFSDNFEQAMKESTGSGLGLVTGLCEYEPLSSLQAQVLYPMDNLGAAWGHLILGVPAMRLSVPCARTFPTISKCLNNICH
jgi:hypothetical protein